MKNPNTKFPTKPQVRPKPNMPDSMGGASVVTPKNPIPAIFNSGANQGVGNSTSDNLRSKPPISMPDPIAGGATPPPGQGGAPAVGGGSPFSDVLQRITSMLKGGNSPAFADGSGVTQLGGGGGMTPQWPGMSLSGQPGQMPTGGLGQDIPGGLGGWPSSVDPGIYNHFGEPGAFPLNGQGGHGGPLPGMNGKPMGAYGNVEQSNPSGRAYLHGLGGMHGGPNVFHALNPNAVQDTMSGGMMGRLSQIAQMMQKPMGGGVPGAPGIAAMPGNFGGGGLDFQPRGFNSF